MDQRIPPQNVEAEQAVLGAMMLEKDAVITALEKLRARDFYRDTHKIIFTAMERLYKNQQEVDIITLPEELRKMKKLDDVGGLEYILSLPNVVATAANLSYHANIVREKALSRDLISTCTELSVEAYSGEKGTEELMDQAEQKILKLADNQNKDSLVPIGQVVSTVVKQVEKLYENKAGLTGLPTGFRDFDRMTSGLQPSDLILIAARPSMGKTAFTLNIAQHVGVRLHKSVAFFSLEMSAEQLTQRMICQLAHVDSQKIRTGQIYSDDEWKNVWQACEKKYILRLFILMIRRVYLLQKCVLGHEDIKQNMD